MESTLPAAVVAVLAVLGGLAIGVRLLAALMGLGLAAAEESAASSLAEASARRGDLTGMLERREAGRRLRRRRLSAVARVLAWAAILVAPPVAGVAGVVYAGAAVLWLLPRRPVLPARHPR